MSAPLTDLIRTCQRAVGVADDGIAGVVTWTAIAQRLGAIPDAPQQANADAGGGVPLDSRRVIDTRRIIATIEGGNIYENAGGSVEFIADMDIDSDGEGGNPWHDRYFQPHTSLRFEDGSSLNSSIDRYIVVPPAIVRGVKGIVLGCRAEVTDTRTGKTVTAVVGDLGPYFKDGEASIALAKALGVPESPVLGGVDERVILYRLWPGIAADGYRLQPIHGIA